MKNIFLASFLTRHEKKVGAKPISVTIHKTSLASSVEVIVVSVVKSKARGLETLLVVFVSTAR